MTHTLWLTGLPASGKTTIARGASKKLGYYVLDGDDLRSSPISNDLGFSYEDRKTNLLRAAEISRIINESGTSVIAAFVSPYSAVRQQARRVIGHDFHEVFISCPRSVCAKRDPKGFWKRAMAGQIHGFTGYDDPYEPPKDPDIIIRTNTSSEEACIDQLVRYTYNLEPRELSVAFIGRWSPFHNGHKAIIDKKLDEGHRVLVLVRDTDISEDSLWTAEERAQMIRSVYRDEVEVRVIPDICSLAMGRDVGYRIETIEVPEETKRISGTTIRDMIWSGLANWDEFVPPSVAEFIKSRG